MTKGLESNHPTHKHNFRTRQVYSEKQTVGKELLSFFSLTDVIFCLKTTDVLFS